MIHSNEEYDAITPRTIDTPGTQIVVILTSCLRCLRAQH